MGISTRWNNSHLLWFSGSFVRGHSDGDDSPRGYVLLAFTRPGVAFDLATMNRDLELQGPVTGVVQLFNIPSKHFNTPR